jgi:hypothetical protein
MFVHVELALSHSLLVAHGNFGARWAFVPYCSVPSLGGQHSQAPQGSQKEGFRRSAILIGYGLASGLSSVPLMVVQARQEHTMQEGCGWKSDAAAQRATVVKLL